MKNEDFERLKAVCEKEGFELELSSPWDQTYRISKKDIWDGVEFLRSIWSNKISPISQVNEKLRDGVKRDDWEISTEQAYIEQLKKEAYQRFGVIKDSDEFIIEGCSPTSTLPFEKDWNYFKEVDILQYYGAIIYQQGEWATKVKERVKVEFSDFNFGIEQGKTPLVEFNFKMYPKGDLNKAGQFLSKQLEAYLNGEMGETMTFTESISIPKNYEG